MFGHVFKYRLKILTKGKAEIFWTLIYPMFLAFVFSLAFSNLASAESFKSIPIDVVDNAAYKSQTAVAETLKAVSDDNSDNQEKLFHVTYTTLEAAQADLESNQIKGYIVFDGGAHVVVKDSGFDQSFIKEFMDSVTQVGSAVTTIIRENPTAAATLSYDGSADYIKDAASGKTQADSMAVYYYGLLAMAALFGSFWGIKEIEDIQADNSPHAMRLNLAPVHKMKAFAASVSAAILIHFASLVLVVAFIALVLKVGFGSQLGYVLLTCFFASLLGVSFGAFVAALVKNNGVRFAVTLAVSLVLSSIAGLVNVSLKFLVVSAVPVMAYINPANLITDAFYALYCYGANARFFLNIALMLAFSVVFSIGVYLVTRGRKYASL
ncbi:ABC transporter permease [Oscillospiraceae bacterium WX1]